MSSHFDDFRTAITQRFVDEFKNGAAIFAPTEMENQPFTQPEAAVWCRLSIREGERRNATITVGHKRTPGMLYLQIFSPEGSGTKAARACADLMAAIFDNVTLEQAWGDILFFTTSFYNVGKREQGWWQHNAVVEFRVDAFDITGEDDPNVLVDDQGIVRVTDDGVAIVTNP